MWFKGNNPVNHLFNYLGNFSCIIADDSYKFYEKVIHIYRGEYIVFSIFNLNPMKSHKLKSVYVVRLFAICLTQ